MGQISLQIPQTGFPNSTEDPKVASDLTTVQNVINGNLDATNISQALGQSATVNVSGQVVKGATNIAGPESRTNTAYGTMPTPDQVTGVVLPSNGLLLILFQASWKCASGTSANAAIFVGSNNLNSIQGNNPVSQGQSAFLTNPTGKLVPLSSCWFGLVSDVEGGADYTGDVTTGQVVGVGNQGSGAFGGPAYIFASAGTYTVSVQYKSATGAVTASNRKLWVAALSFA